jgi:hypothetical protein
MSGALAVKLDANDRAYGEIKARLSNRWWRLNNLYWITNERGEHVPFKPNKAQTEFYFALWYLNVVLKARQMGFSTFIQILILDACLFTSNIRAGVIAHTREDAEVLFRDKVRYAYEHLPASIKSTVRASSDRAGELAFSNGSSIRVGTSMRSGTLQYLHVSELGKIARKFPEKAEEIKTGALNTLHAGSFVFFESTAEGRHGLFFDTVESALKRDQLGLAPNELEFKLHFFPWWADARYRMSHDAVVLTSHEIEYFRSLEQNQGIRLDAEQMAWYAAKARMQGDKMLQEYPSTVAEAFEAKISGAIYANEMARVRAERRITVVPYAAEVPVNTFWDLGKNDTNAIWFHQRVGLQNRFIDFYENRGYSLAHYAQVLKERGYVYGRHYLPHDARVGDISREDNLSRAEVLESLGLRPVEIVPRIQDLNEGLEMTRQALASCWFDAAKCDEGIKALDAYQREWDDRIGEYKDRPLHNWASNPADALRQFAQGYRSPKAMSGPQRRTKANWRTA